MIEYKLKPEDVGTLVPPTETENGDVQWGGGWHCEYKDARGKWHRFTVSFAGVPDAHLAVALIRSHAEREGVLVDQ